MQRFILDKDYAAEYARVHRFIPHPQTPFLSRCIDGRYPVSSQLPALATPGGDAGELAILLATAHVYGFELDAQKAQAILLDIIGGGEHFSSEPVSSCMHLTHVFSDPAAYNLHPDDLKTLTHLLGLGKTEHVRPVLLEGKHQEGAVLQIKGNWSVQPSGIIETEHGNIVASVLIFHQTLAGARQRRIADELLTQSAVKLFDGLDAEYLSEAFSSVTEDHLLETLKREAAGLPIYQLNYTDEGASTLKDLGTV